MCTNEIRRKRRIAGDDYRLPGQVPRMDGCEWILLNPMPFKA